MTRDPTDGELGRDDATDRLAHEIEAGMRPSTAVVHAVAALTDTAVLDQEPLYDAIDPDHLDEAFGDRGDDLRAGSISFRYSGCRVTVDRDTVHVETDPE